MACEHCGAPEGKPHGSECPGRTTAVARRTPAAVQSADIAVGQGGLQLTKFDDMMGFAQTVIEAGLAPKGMNKPAQVVIAIQAGAELGFTPMRALGCMKVINGRAGPMTNAAKALVLSSDVLKENTSIDEWITVGDELAESIPKDRLDEAAGHCMSYRKGWPAPKTTTFSWQDAKMAGLTVKDTYKSYPERMLLARARGFHFDDNYPDVLMGMHLAEVLHDYPSETVGGSDALPVTPTTSWEEPVFGDAPKVDPILEGVTEETKAPEASPPPEPEDTGPPIEEGFGEPQAEPDQPPLVCAMCKKEIPKDSVPVYGPRGPMHEKKCSSMASYDPAVDNCPMCHRSPDIVNDPNLGHEKGCDFQEVKT